MLIIDTNVWVSGLLFGGTPKEVFRTLRDGRGWAYLSNDQMGELIDVLSGAKLTRRLRELHVSVIELVEDIQRMSVHLPVHEQPFVPTLRDQDDLHLLAAAKASLKQILPAQAIITGDLDLLVLEEFEGIPIMNPTQWLAARKERE